ncbi:MAG: hypothetical protein AB8I08_40940 [Sandaracinaceae bacterium]
MRRNALLVLLALVTACASPGTTPDDPGALVSRVPAGKADDYYSNVAAEFEVRGSLAVDVAADATPEERELAAAVVYLTTRLTKKLDDFFSNTDYGGFAAMVRNQTSEAVELTEGSLDPDEATLRAANELSEAELLAALDDRAVPGILEARPFVTLEELDAVPYVGPSAMSQLEAAGQARFSGSEGLVVHFTVDVAGPGELPSLLGREFDLQMPAGATSDASGSLSTVRNFDPATYSGELESVACTLENIPAARNGFPAYAAFFEDGVFDITLFQGHDYNESRGDLWETFELVWTMESEGFSDDEIVYLDEPDAVVRDALNFVLGEQAEQYAETVDRVSRLSPESGPYTKTLLVNGDTVRAEVRIFHSEMFRTDRPGQRQRAIDEIVSRDVFFYNGHAGPWYGFYLDDAGEAEITETEFATLPFTNRQQLVIMNGCQTYSQYADMLYANPAKSEDNLDVITTVNFSYGQSSDMLLGALTNTDTQGDHVAWSYGDLIRAFNENTVNEDNQVFYGVTGIDGNDKMHPYARPDLAGQACSSGWDCGNAYGNACDGTCAPRALSAEGCPEGTTFASFAEGDTIEGGACWR